MEDFQILLGAILDAKAKGDIDKQLKAIDDLAVTVSKVNLDQSVINDLKKKLSSNGIDINLVFGNTNQIQKQSQTVGTQIGNTISQSVNKAMRSLSDLKIGTGNIEAVFDKDGLVDVEASLNKIKEIYSEFGQVTIKNKLFDSDGELQSFKVNIEQVNGELKETRSFMMALNGNSFSFPDDIIKGSESIVQHLDKSKNAINQTGDAINNLAQKTQAINIKDKFGDFGNTTTNINVLVSKFERLGTVSEDTQKRIDSLKTDLQTMNSVTIVNGSDSEIIAHNDRIIRSYQELNNEYKQITNNAKLYATAQQRLSLANTIEAWNQKNTKATKEVRQANDEYVKSLRDLSVAMTQVEMSDIRRQFKESENSMRTLNKLGKSLKDQLSQAKDSFVQWFSVSSAVMTVVYQLQKIPSEVKKIDDSVTDLIMATGLAKSEAKELMNTFADIGDEHKASMVDVSTSVTEWLKQGKDLNESLKLAQDSIVLSKIGELSSEDSTKTITAAMKSYDLAADKVMDFVDQISAIDMASATDVGGLSEAFNEVAANARSAGVETEKLLAYAAAIGETTQEGMSSVGNSLNAMLSRMSNIKLSRLTDPETGEDLNNVETSLRNVGIELRSEIGTFRDFDEVLAEIAGKWDTYNDVTQRSIASSIAGTHHLNDFFVLMSQWDNVEKYIEEATNASGSSMKKFEAYQESITGKLERFENAFQSLSKTVLDSDFLGGLVDTGTGFINLLDTITDKIGVLSTAGIGIGANLGGKNAGKHIFKLNEQYLLYLEMPFTIKRSKCKFATCA